MVRCTSGEGADTVLDGFTITGGTGTELLGYAVGGGMCNNSSSPTVSNCTFSANNSEQGGGMFNWNGSHPMVSKCTFGTNTSTYFGGGMYNDDSSPTLTRCTFTRNTATNSGGGGMFNNSRSSPTMAACSFSGNVSEAGSAIYNNESDPTLTNCTFTANTGGSGYGMTNDVSNPIVTNCTFAGNRVGGMQNSGSGPQVTNCIFWGNGRYGIYNFNTGSNPPIVSHSDVQGGLTGEIVDGGGNIDTYPGFVDADGADDVPGTEDDDLRLQIWSLCRNAGDPAFLPEPSETDIDGHPRVLCGRVDMGAHEFGMDDHTCNGTGDLIDFRGLVACMTGPDGGPYGAGCEAFDFDGDGDVDQQDYAGFAMALSAP